MNEVAKAQRQLAFAQLAEEYDALQAKVQDGSASDDDRARYRELAQQVQAARSELRVEREAEAQTIADGDGVAQPGPVAGSSGVH